MRRPLRLIVFFGHEVNESVAYRRAASSPTRRRLTSDRASWGKPKRPIRVGPRSLVTESAHKVVVVEKITRFRAADLITRYMWCLPGESRSGMDSDCRA